MSQFKNRTLILNHSKFCSQPKREIDKMLSFCNFRPNSELLNSLYEIPKNTGSNNRYKKYSLEIFNDEQLEFVKQMGFEISGT